MIPHALLDLAVPFAFVGMLLVERWRSARVFPTLYAWTALGLGLFVVMELVEYAVLGAMPVAWFARHHLLDAERLGPIGAVVAGVLGVSLTNYVVHRTMHRHEGLWEALHRLHHMPRRVDLAGGPFVHPIETAMVAGPSLVVLFGALGLSFYTASVVGVVTTLCSLFKHWNITTPRWLGYIVQRPESHRAHHATANLDCNYSFLPLWDVLFGTFFNPERFDDPVGFEPATCGAPGVLLGALEARGAQVRVVGSARHAS